RRRRGRNWMAVLLRLQRLQQPQEAGVRRHDLACAALEEVAPLRGDRVGVLEVILEQVARVTGVEAVDVHYACCSRGSDQSGLLVIPATAMPTAKQSALMKTAAVASRALRPPIPTAMSERTIARGMRRSGR